MERNFILTLLLFVAQICHSQFYYPLRIGNQWTYVDSILRPYPSATTSSASVDRDTVMPNGRHYFALTGNTFLSQHGDTTFSWFESDGESIRYLCSPKMIDTIKYTFYGDQNWIKIVHRDSINIFGTLRQAWFFFTPTPSSSTYNSEIVVDSIGLVYSVWGDSDGIYFADYCTSAIVDDINYHTITPVRIPPTVPNHQLYLFQNYPNPFNPITTISYDVRSKGYVALRLYNAVGQLVSTLQEGIHDPGNYHIELNGSNLSSGVYFYRLNGSNFSQTRSMLLLK